MSSGKSGRRPGGAAVKAALAALSLSAVAALALSPAAAPTRSDNVTIGFLTVATTQPDFNVLIPNFERVYPNITVDPVFVSSNPLEAQLELTELGAGSAPALLGTLPGCGNPNAVCELAKAGDLAPMVAKPWVKRSLPLVTSLDKSGQGLYAFEPSVSPDGVFTNDGLFKKLGLQIPQTFSQLLNVCQKAKAAGVAAVDLGGATGTSVSNLVVDIAVATVYGKDRQWPAELRAGKVTFDGTAGWHQALQQFVDMSNAGCFELGMTGTSSTAAEALFAQGQGLMWPTVSGLKGTLDADSPQFSYTFHQFPGGSEASQTRSFLFLGNTVSVNAHASTAEQAAAQQFVDFIARPKQNALYAQVGGGLTQYEFLKGQIPSFMSDFAPVFTQHDYVNDPIQSWWNANVLLALQQDEIGLVTGQTTIDDVLNAMDAAWRQGPS